MLGDEATQSSITIQLILTTNSAQQSPQVELRKMLVLNLHMLPVTGAHPACGSFGVFPLPTSAHPTTLPLIPASLLGLFKNTCTRERWSPGVQSVQDARALLHSRAGRPVMHVCLCRQSRLRTISLQQRSPCNVFQTRDMPRDVTARRLEGCMLSLTMGVSVVDSAFSGADRCTTDQDAAPW